MDDDEYTSVEDHGGAGERGDAEPVAERDTAEDYRFDDWALI